jgi:hypothetical protein
MKKKGSRMPRNRAEMPLERIDKANQVGDSQNKDIKANRCVIYRPLGNRACCCFIGK